MAVNEGVIQQGYALAMRSGTWATPGSPAGTYEYYRQAVLAGNSDARSYLPLGYTLEQADAVAWKENPSVVAEVARLNALTPEAVMQNVNNRIQDLQAAGRKLAPGAGAMIQSQVMGGMGLEAALALVDASATALAFAPTFDTQAQKDQEAAILAAQKPYVDPNSVGAFTSSWVVPTPARESGGRDISAIVGATSTPTTQTVNPGVAQMSLGSIVGGIAKNILGELPGGTLLTQGAKALLDSRRDTPAPPSTGGVPQILNPLAMAQAGWQAGQQIVGQIGSSIAGMIPGSVGLGLTNYLGGTQVTPGKGMALGAVGPMTKSTTIHRCPKGYVLAIDGNCYPKSMLPRGLRKWKPDPKPVVSRSDQKAIRRAASAKHRLVKITKDSGAFASIHKPTRSAAHGPGCLCARCKSRKK